MKKGILRGIPFSVGGFLVVFILLAGPVARGEEARRSPRHPEEEDHTAARITLSLRIAEAKGEKAAQKYFRSLLRQSKRKRSRKNPSEKSGFRKVH